MHQGELARSPSLAQAEMIQRLNPVAVSRPRPPRLTPATASISLHDDAEEGQEGKEEGEQEQERNAAKVAPDLRKRDSRIGETNDDDDDDNDTLKTCEETTAADPTLVKAAAATGTAQILETLRARERFKWEFKACRTEQGTVHYIHVLVARQDWHPKLHPILKDMT